MVICHHVLASVNFPGYKADPLISLVHHHYLKLRVASSFQYTGNAPGASQAG